MRHLLANRAAVGIVLNQVKKSDFQNAYRLGARALRFGQRERDLGLFASDGNACFHQKAHSAEQLDELRTSLLDRCAIILAEVGDGLVIRRDPPSQPHNLEIAPSLTLQPPA